jgi:hypothetical protein
VKNQEMGEESTRVMIGVNESSLKGYPHPSISSKGAFDWTVSKIIRNNVSAFHLLFLHVQVPDEDGQFLSFSLNPFYFLILMLFYEIIYSTDISDRRRVSIMCQTLLIGGVSDTDTCDYLQLCHVLKLLLMCRC